MAQLIVVGRDEDDKVKLYDVSQVSADTLGKALPLLEPKEKAFYDAATSAGYNVVQRFIYAVTAQNTSRTYQLLTSLGF